MKAAKCFRLYVCASFYVCSIGEENLFLFEFCFMWKVVGNKINFLSFCFLNFLNIFTFYTNKNTKQCSHNETVEQTFSILESFKLNGSFAD